MKTTEDVVLNLSYQSAKYISVSGNCNSLIEEKNKDKEIIAVNFGSTTRVELGSLIPLAKGKKPFKIRKIVREDYSIQTGYFNYTFWYDNTNDSSIFLLPMLSLTDGQHGMKDFFLWTTHFVNCYLQVEGGRMDEDFYLLYRFEGVDKFITLENWILNHPNFIDRTEPDKYHSLYKFKVPESQVKNYNRFIKGNFSGFDLEYKERLTAFHNWSDNSRWKKVIYRDTGLRQELEAKLGVKIPAMQDLNEIPDIENKETYLSDMIINETLYGEEK